MPQFHTQNVILMDCATKCHVIMLYRGGSDNFKPPFRGGSLSFVPNGMIK